MKHEKFDSMDVIAIICCIFALVVLGLCVYVTVNSPVTDGNGKNEISQGLSYTDYVDFVNKEEKCQD